MENRNGRGIFLGVVSVATLIVAIIGATFAYFVASSAGNNGAVSAGTASVQGTITMTEEVDARTNMIPVHEDVLQLSYAQTGTTHGAAATDQCAGVSAAGGSTVYNLCSLYTFTITNSASVAQTVYVSLTTNTTTIPNLWYALYDGSTLVTNTKATAANGGLSSAGAAVTGSDLGVFKVVPNANATDQNLTSVLLTANGGTQTYTLVLYVHDTGQDQTSADSGSAYTGTVTVTSSDGSHNITGAVTTGS